MLLKNKWGGKITMQKIKMYEDSQGEYLLVKLVKVEKMSPEGIKHWSKESRKKIRMLVYKTIPNTKKLYIFYNTKEKLIEWLTCYISPPFRVQIHRFIHRKRLGVPKYFSVPKKMADIEVLKSGRVKIHSLKGFQNLKWFNLCCY